MRRLLLALVLASPAIAFAQTPPPSTVTAEGSETVRLTPNVARLHIIARSQNEDSDTAGEEAAEKAKKFADAVGKLQLKTVKASLVPLKAGKSGGDADFNPRRQGEAPKTFTVTRGVVVTVTDADFAALSAAVEKVQRLALKNELGGEEQVDDYRPYRSGENGTIRVSYSRTDGEQELLTAALAKATKKAAGRAEAIAGGLGLKLGAVVSAEEVSNEYRSGPVRYSFASDTEDGLVDGELVRTVRVKVVYAVSK